MHLLRVWGLALSLTSIAVVSARRDDGRVHANMVKPAAVPLISAPDPSIPVKSRNGTELPPYTTTFYFDQLIDHKNPSLGTFKQRFWHTWEFYETGGPIILMSPGEANAQGYSGYLTNRTINGLIAQQQNGSVVVLEHRFYGLSNPYPDLSVKSLKYHTIQQAIDDYEYFAKNVNLPMPNGDSVTPDKAPWILVGGSYAGALVSWTMVNKPGVFYAGYASSAVVETIIDFWQYFEPIRQNMPRNCSSDVQAVISYIDKTFSGRNKTAINAIKDNFGLGELDHLDDVAGALRNNLWDWQSLQVTTGSGGQFYRFCDALEVKDGVSASAKGWGVEHALAAWGNYWKTIYLSGLCKQDSIPTCLGTYNASLKFYTDEAIDNVGRSWFWTVCNEVGYLQEGAPWYQPTLVTRLVDPAYDMRQCQLMFPKAFKSPPVPKTLLTNLKYQGWRVNQKNLFFANGDRDPWREATMSSQDRNAESTSHQPIGLGKGFHCSDMGVSAAIEPTIKNVQDEALTAMKKWLSAWKPTGHGGPIKTPRPVPHPFQGFIPPVIIRPINAWFRRVGGL